MPRKPDVKNETRAVQKVSPIPEPKAPERELVVITGLSGAGKGTAMQTLEDLGYYSVENLPVAMLEEFAKLVSESKKISRAAIVVDVREGRGLERFPALLRDLRKTLPTRVLFLEAEDKVLLRRFSETRRPHPLGKNVTVLKSLREERKQLDAVRKVADILLDTSRFNVHELRAHLENAFQRGDSSRKLLVSVMSFGYRAGVPPEADIVFDVRFLPNPHFVPEFRALTGRHPKVAKYVRDFPQTGEFLDRTGDLLKFLLPHYVAEGKSYLTIAFGCTGGQHRSVMVAEDMTKRLRKQGQRVKVQHRDMPR